MWPKLQVNIIELTHLEPVTIVDPLLLDSDDVFWCHDKILLNRKMIRYVCEDVKKDIKVCL